VTHTNNRRWRPEAGRGGGNRPGSGSPSNDPSGVVVMSSLLLAAASVAKLRTPHIDYLSILPILIMMGGAVLLVTVSSLFRQ